jgi:hypothetical protein
VGARRARHRPGIEASESPGSRGIGPATSYATALWLRDGFADLRWEFGEVVAEGDLVVVHCTMRGRHARPSVSYDAQARVDEVFPSPARSSSAGWPPTPLYLIRAALAKRRARRAVA